MCMSDNQKTYNVALSTENEQKQSVCPKGVSLRPHSTEPWFAHAWSMAMEAFITHVC